MCAPLGELPWTLPHSASAASLEAISASSWPFPSHKLWEAYTVAESLQQPGKLSVLGGQPQLMLQPVLDSSRRFAEWRLAVAGHIFLRTFCEVVIGSVLMKGLNLLNSVKTTGMTL